MPSFLSRVFGGKKDDDKKERRLSAPSTLLEGKFEAVSPSVSPSAQNFTVPLPEKEKDKGLLRTFSRVPDKEKEKASDLPPHLSLNLSDTRNLATLDEVFRGAVLSEEELRDKTLSVNDCLSLVKVCAAVIALHGLETPGIMHPHWHSSSPETQQRLLSSFFSSPDWQTNFRHESNMHDIAAVFRWAFRHLSLGSSSFGNAQDWYTSFSTSERQKSYPQTAYSTILRPLVPDTNMELLQVTLNLLSSLASHAERNATSASKLSKVLGFGLLDTQTPQGTWEEFYSRWERSGRILEHLFLASIRDEAASSSHPMPKRLIELINGYPYAKEETLDDLLPRPRFSTRKYTALYVNLTTEVSSPPPASDTALARKKKSKAKATSPPGSKKKQVYDAIGILTEALTTSNSITSSDAELWNALRSSYSSSLGSLFTDETVRLLTIASPSAAPGGAAAAPKEPTFIYTPSEEGGSHRRSFSLDTPPRQPSSRIGTNGSNSPTSPIGVDWAQFSTSGFLDSPVTGTGLAGTLLDGDVEVTTPVPSRKTSKSKRASSRTRRSTDVPPISTSLPPPAEEKDKKKSEIKEVKKIEIDESFVEFFADSVIDRRSEMVQFVIAKLRSEVVKADVEWVVVEKRFGDVSKPKPTEEEQIESENGKVSPKKEKEKEKMSPTTPKSLDSILSSTKKRFTFFAPSKSSKESNKESSEKKRNSVKVGEMGEILKEEDESEKKEAKDISIPAYGSAAVVAAEVVGDNPTKEPETKPENGVVDQAPAEPKAENGVAEHIEPTTNATPEPAAVEAAEAKPKSGLAGHEEKATSKPQIQLVPATEVKVPEAVVVDGVPISPKTEEVVHAVVGPEDQVLEPQVESLSQPQVEASAGRSQPEAQPEVVPEVPAQVEPEPEVAPEEPVLEAAAPEPEPEPEVQAPVEIEHQEVAAAQPEPEVEAPVEAGMIEQDAPTEPEPEGAREHVEEAEPEPEPEVEVSAAEPEPQVVEPVSNPEVPSHVEAEPEAEQDPEPEAPAPIVHEVDAHVESEPAAEIASEASVPEPEPEVIEEEPVAEADVEAPVPVIEPIREPSPGRYEEETVSLDPVPTVEAEPTLAPEGAVGLPPTDTNPSSLEEPLAEEEEPAALESEEQIPPAPESVLLSGSTPGPEIALSTSESTAIHEASNV